jgi:hypothetical protein
MSAMQVESRVRPAAAQPAAHGIYVAQPLNMMIFYVRDDRCPT